MADTGRQPTIVARIRARLKETRADEKLARIDSLFPAVVTDADEPTAQAGTPAAVPGDPRITDLHEQIVRLRGSRDDARGVATQLRSLSEDPQTTPRRTYRYLRLVMIGAVGAIFLAVGLTWQEYHHLIPTISHFFYTPAGVVFVGSLIAAAAAMVALSGDGVQQVLLDVAAMLAPIIALVPTNADNAILTNLRQNVCPDGREVCVPSPFDGYATIGMTVWCVAVPVVLLIALAIGIADRRSSGKFTPQFFWTQALCWLVWIAMFTWFIWFRDGFFAAGHYVSAVAFFVVVTLVALWQAILGPLQTRREIANGEQPTPLQRTLPWVYWLIAALLVAVLLMGGAIFTGLVKPGPDGMFWVEAWGLIGFGVFWLIQTLQKWRVLDA
jgi:heme exporter protein D